MSELYLVIGFLAIFGLYSILRFFEEKHQNKELNDAKD